MLDSVTHYECYKGLWSSHMDHNYFDIAYAFKPTPNSGAKLPAGKLTWTDRYDSQPGEPTHIHPSLELGNYQELYVSHNQLAFPRTWKEEKALAAANTADYPIQLETNVSLPKQLDFTHALDPKRFYQVVNKTIYPQLELYEGVILVN
jgi:hypothetical protein